MPARGAELSVEGGGERPAVEVRRGVDARQRVERRREIDVAHDGRLAARLRVARVDDGQRHVRPLVAEEVVAVADAVAVVVERLAVVGRHDDAPCAGDAVALDSVEDRLRRVVDGGHGAVVEAAHLRLVARVGGRVAAEARRACRTCSGRGKPGR